ncbi:MAG: hypothetical protein ACI88H_001296 [Cocleimonas sp.]|jgi:hypothetical protein
MNQSDQQLAHTLKIKYGTAPSEPNEQQLAAIKMDIQTLVNQGRSPTENDWQEIVTRHCPDAGRYKYAGADNSDLVTLLQMATKK